MSDKPERVPHKDRPEVVARYCSCVWVHTPNSKNPNGPARARVAVRNPTCKLHGDHVAEAPF